MFDGATDVGAHCVRPRTCRYLSTMRHPERRRSRSRRIFAPNDCSAPGKCVDSSISLRSTQNDALTKMQPIYKIRRQRRRLKYGLSDKSVLYNLPWGFPRGKRKKCWKKKFQSASLLGRLESPRTIRKVLGDSLHTFSSVRKYEHQAVKKGDCHTRKRAVEGAGPYSSQ